MKCIIMSLSLSLFLLRSLKILCIFHAPLKYASLEQWNHWVGQDRKQIGCVMKLFLPLLTNKIDLSSQLMLKILQKKKKKDNFTRWMPLFYGLWSLESSWLSDIKVASRLFLAANYIKQLCSSGLDSVPTPASSLFSNFFETSFWIHYEKLKKTQETISTLESIKDMSDSETACKRTRTDRDRQTHGWEMLMKCLVLRDRKTSRLQPTYRYIWG